MKEVKSPKKPLIYYYGIVLVSSQQRTVRNLLTRHLQGQEDLTGECR